eukprot:CAMPEP_0197180080 /NCGR_PEP_ID=MMETSP1423-20130617/4818_1 /TAXON_ID=476441 /ORGANISM="Pseudo-nitzschia heimii, Strain UNC1101" /LENGTH=336 /DNA_ID=CAMNT_0042630101 /DNA_START=32 /DNA_END=1042 /DNA_ORIENTATION=+
MPPSVPPNGVANDATTGNARTHLPLLRETPRNPDLLTKSSSGNALKKSQQRLSETTNPEITRSNINKLLLNNKKRMIIRKKKKSKSRPASSPSSRPRNVTRVENDSGSIEDADSSLEQVPSATNPTLDASALAPYGGIGTVSPYGLYGGAGSMMPPSPYMGMGMNTMGLPYLSGFNQMVYNIQSIVFSISNAIHVIGANQEALRHAWESLNQMIENAVVTFHEMRALESVEREFETDEEREKRKRLKVLRYAFVFGGSWLAYKLIRNLLFRKRSLQKLKSAPVSLGSNHYGRSNFDNMTMGYSGASPMSNYISPNNFYGAMNSGHSGYSGFGNGYY